MSLEAHHESAPLFKGYGPIVTGIQCAISAAMYTLLLAAIL